MNPILPQAHIGAIPKTSGIYAIVCTANGKLYVGQAKSLLGRKHWHFNYLNGNRHPNKYLQGTWNKYGAEAFYFAILEYTAPNKNLLTQQEQYWMDYYAPLGLFNLAPSAGSNLGFKHSDTTKEKMRIKATGRVQTEDTKEKLRIIKLNPTDELRRKMSEAHKGKPVSDKQKELVRLKLLNRPDHSKRVAQIDFMHTVVTIHPSANEAARKVHGHTPNISDCCNGKGHNGNTYRGFYWCYLNEDGTPDTRHIPNECQRRLFD